MVHNLAVVMRRRRPNRVEFSAVPRSCGMFTRRPHLSLPRGGQDRGRHFRMSLCTFKMNPCKSSPKGPVWRRSPGWLTSPPMDVFRSPTSFMSSWICRQEVDVLPITLRFRSKSCWIVQEIGGSKWVIQDIEKSERNCSLSRWPNFKVLKCEKSRL